MCETHRFVCRNEECATRDGMFCLEIPEEILMDEKTVAEMFCPRCRGRLSRCSEAEIGFDLSVRVKGKRGIPQG